MANGLSFFAELRRRNVYRVGIAYVVVAWLVLQAIDIILPIMQAPDWFSQMVLVLLAIGFPFALIFAWAYEMTPEGLKLEKDVDRTASITQETGQHLNRIIIGVLVVAVGLLLADKFLLSTNDASIEQVAVSEAEESAEVTATGTPSIAVLPFANMSADESSTYFSDGLADTLLHMLAQIREIRVAARTSSFQFRDQNTDITKIAEALNVGTILEGSVQRAGNKIRVTAQLIEAETGYHLWSGNYDRSLDDVFAIQDEIANEVVAALKVSLLGESATRLTEHGTENVAAYTEYLLAINDMNKFSFESMRRAEQRFLNALRTDPGYGLAWARLGELYLNMDEFGVGDFEEMNEKARDAASKALDLDANSAVAIAVLAEVEHNYGNTDMAEQLFERAIELGPNEAVALHGLAAVLTVRNEREKAVELLLEALARDPLSTTVLGQLAGHYRIMGKTDAALAYITKMREIEPESPYSWYREAYVQFDLGNWALATVNFERAHELDPDDPETAAAIADHYLALGMMADARKWYDRSTEIDPAHPVARSAPLAVYLYERSDSPDGPALARQLLDEDMASRQNARALVLQTLWDDAVRNDTWDATIDLLRDHFPEYFEADGAWGSFDVTDWFVGAMLFAAGHEDQAMRIMQPFVETSAESSRKYRVGNMHAWNLAATGQRDELLAALHELTVSRRAPATWPVSVTRLHAFDFVRDEPEFIAYAEWLESHAVEQREILRELLGESSAQQKRGPT